LNSWVQAQGLKLWTPGRDIAVDECMIRFTGRSFDITTIKSKPIPTGYKVWGIAQKGFLLSWFWHSNGKGPQGIDPHKDLDLNQTAAVVVNLAEKLPERPRELPYHIWLDNLFPSTKLLVCLREKGFGATGTCRINSGICEEFVKLKNQEKTKDSTPWGTLYQQPTPDKKIMQTAWKDQAMVLMLSTVYPDDNKTIERNRRRPKTTSSCAKTSRLPFGECSRKMLAIPVMVDDYNHNMGAVDIADQLRSNNEGLRRIRRGGWYALFKFIVNVVLCNCYLLSKYKDQSVFRQALIEQLVKKWKKEEPKALSKRPRPIQTGKYHTLGYRGPVQDCRMCRELGIVAKKRQPLGEITTNSVVKNRGCQTRYGCITCNIALCKEGRCFEQYHLE